MYVNIFGKYALQCKQLRMKGISTGINKLNLFNACVYLKKIRYISIFKVRSSFPDQHRYFKAQ